MTFRTSLRSRIPEIRAELPEKLDLVTRLGAESIEADAKTRVPVQSGNLRDAIHTEKVEDAQYRVIAGDSDVFYGHIIEHGSVKQGPRPFLVPAAESRRDDILDSIKHTLRGL